jgi:hypothetical protein
MTAADLGRAWIMVANTYPDFVQYPQSSEPRSRNLTTIGSAGRLDRAYDLGLPSSGFFVRSRLAL